jgi:hypothetical protein
MLEERGIHATSRGLGRLALVAIAMLLASVLIVPSAGAAKARTAMVKRMIVKVHETRGERRKETITTPQLNKITLDRTAIIKILPKGEKAPNVLVLEPGTSAAAAYFVPFAKSLVQATPGWQVWAVERRENFLENQSELTKYKFGELPSELKNENTGENEAPSEQFFNYYLGYLGQDQKRATKEATAAVEAKVVAIVTKQATRKVEEKVEKIAKEEVEAFVVEQVEPQASKEFFEEGIGSSLEEDIAKDAAKYSAEHAAELKALGLKDALSYAKEHAAELQAEGLKIGEELGAKYAAEHAAELAAEGQKIGEEDFNKLLAKFTNHYEPVPDSLVEFAKEWGMNRTVEDLKVVIEKAKALGGKVVLGGHSLGGSVVTAYATWDFGGHPGAEGLSGLVYDDGGSGPAISKGAAEKSLAKLDGPGETPWLAFGGIPAPDLGLFSITGSTLTTVEPKGPSLLETFPFLPSDLKGPISPVTNEAGFGFSVNVGTSPVSLAAAQIHGGQGIEAAAEMDGLHGWNGTGALTPVSRYAEMLAGTGLREMSGSEWYFPARLTLDTGAVGNGLANPAQEVLGVHSTMGEHLPKSLHILAIDSELDKLFGGGGTTLTEAEALVAQSGIPPSNVTLIEAKDTYAHNDPAGATPEINEFFQQLVPYLKAIA